MKRILFHPLSIVILTVLAISFFVSMRQNAEKAKLSSQNISVLEQEITNLASEVNEDQASLSESETELAKEKILRNELLLQKSGEYIVQLPNFINDAPVTTVTPEPTKKPLEQWREVLFAAP